ncbi:endonuclease [Candidatus Micrarchaeota archaeon]|nr:endonuclease [Candidatus Micrarchaeota archaeon]
MIGGDLMDFLLVLLALLIALLVLFVFWFYAKSHSLQQQLEEVLFRKDSQSVKYGKLTEQWIPFSDRFPHSPERFRFLGNPIDGIVFEDNKIVFCEFKTATAFLNEKQKRIRELVLQKKVEWLEFKIK